MMIYNNYRFSLPKRVTIRVITDTDAKNQADDQFAIVHTLLSPRFDNCGLIAAHFENKYGFDPLEASYKELLNILNIMGMPQELAHKGAGKPMPDQKTPVPSPGAQLIIDEAMKDDERPLFVTALGPLTDIASAYLMEPKIAKRMTLIWIGGGIYPQGGWEYNLQNDIHAANVVFGSDIPVWQVPKNVYQQPLVSMAELQSRVLTKGKLGQYLYGQIMEYLELHSSKSREVGQSETWCLGDSPVVALMLMTQRHSPDIDAKDFDWIPAPEITSDMAYIHTGINRPIRVYKKIDQRFLLEDFYAKLALFAEQNG